MERKKESNKRSESKVSIKKDLTINSLSRSVEMYRLCKHLQITHPTNRRQDLIRHPHKANPCVFYTSLQCIATNFSDFLLSWAGAHHLQQCQISLCLHKQWQPFRSNLHQLSSYHLSLTRDFLQCNDEIQRLFSRFFHFYLIYFINITRSRGCPFFNRDRTTGTIIVFDCSQLDTITVDFILYFYFFRLFTTEQAKTTYQCRKNKFFKITFF